MASKPHHLVAVFLDPKGIPVVTAIDLASMRSTSAELKAPDFTVIRTVALLDGTIAILGRRSLRGSIVRLSGRGELVSVYDVSDPEVQVLVDAVDTAQGLVFLAARVDSTASLRSRDLYLGRMDTSGKVLSKRTLTTTNHNVFGIAQGTGSIGLLFDETEGVARIAAARVVGDVPEGLAYQPQDTGIWSARLVSSTTKERVFAMLTTDYELLVRGMGNVGPLWTCTADIHYSQQDMASDFFPVGGTGKIAFSHSEINNGRARHLLKILVVPK